MYQPLQQAIPDGGRWIPISPMYAETDDEHVKAKGLSGNKRKYWFDYFFGPNKEYLLIAGPGKTPQGEPLFNTAALQSMLTQILTGGAVTPPPPIPSSRRHQPVLVGTLSQPTQTPKEAINDEQTNHIYYVLKTTNNRKTLFTVNGSSINGSNLKFNNNELYAYNEEKQLMAGYYDHQTKDVTHPKKGVWYVFKPDSSEPQSESGIQFLNRTI